MCSAKMKEGKITAPNRLVENCTLYLVLHEDWKTKDTKLNLIFRKMGNMDPLRGAVLCEVPGKGLGLVATKGLCLFLLSSSTTHSQSGNLSSLSVVRADVEF